MAYPPFYWIWALKKQFRDKKTSQPIENRSVSPP